MGIFDFFKKKKEDTFSDSLTLKDLQKGDILEYFLKSWKVDEVLEYDWGNNIFSREYKLNSGDDVIYIELDEDDNDSVLISRDIKISKINPRLKGYIIDNDTPMKELEYKGIKYYFSEENVGECYAPGEDDASSLVSWTLDDEEEDSFISISRWDETDIEASVGEYGKVFEFSNIIRP
ncbi:MAG: DUF4178 domain-containing protein [Ichthyobacteriaceae bacterium]|nr:DUF4178 domain-containing protein [Ichthyobacteriaceae bacterium]